jgi:transposase
VARKPRQAARRRTHSRATTTPRVRRAIQASEETNIALAKRYRVNRKTIAKWKGRESTSDERMGPKNPRPSLLTFEDEAIILAYRWRTRLALDDAHLRLRRLMPKLSRSTLYRCLKHRGLSRIGSTATCPPLTTVMVRGPYFFEITVQEVIFYPDDIGVVYPVFLAIEEITKDAYAEVSDPQQAYELDQRRGRGPHLDKAIGQANGEADEEGDQVPDHDGLLFLRPQHDAASRACRDFAVGLLRLAEPAGRFDRRRTVISGDESWSQRI